MFGLETDLSHQSAAPPPAVPQLRCCLPHYTGFKKHDEEQHNKLVNSQLAVAPSTARQGRLASALKVPEYHAIVVAEPRTTCGAAPVVPRKGMGIAWRSSSLLASPSAGSVHPWHKLHISDTPMSSAHDGCSQCQHPWQLGGQPS